MATLINHRAKNSSFMFPKHVCSELKIQPRRAGCPGRSPFPTLAPGVLGLEMTVAAGQVLHWFFLVFSFPRVSHHFPETQARALPCSAETPSLSCALGFGCWEFPKCAVMAVATIAGGGEAACVAAGSRRSCL